METLFTKHGNIVRDEKGGFVVLIAIITMSIVVTVGLGTMDISLREFKLARIEAGSFIALHAADAGIDCAFHLDSIPQLVLSPPTSNIASPLNVNKPQVGHPDYRCVGVLLTRAFFSTDAAPGGISHTTYLTGNGPIRFSNGSCADVTVTKTQTDATHEKVRIVSDGFDLCTSGGAPAQGAIQRTIILDWESV